MSQALVVLADGFEEIEAVTPIDLLRRAGIGVIVAGVDALTVTGRRGVKIQCDVILGSNHDFDALILPGGRPGADHLAQSPELKSVLEAAVSNDHWVGAICAAPAVVLGPWGYLKGKSFTGYPGTDTVEFGGNYGDEAVVCDGKLLTSRGVGTASAFALALVAVLTDQATADRVARETLLRD